MVGDQAIAKPQLFTLERRFQAQPVALATLIPMADFVAHVFEVFPHRWLLLHKSYSIGFGPVAVRLIKVLHPARVL